MPNSIRRSPLILTLLFLFSFASPAVQALELDWSGQFRFDYNFIHNYTLDGVDTVDGTRAGANGYYITPAGSNNASFETLFMRLRPKLVVNDNVYIKSEFWLGNPIYGLFGDAVPQTFDQRQYNSTFSRGSLISAQRFWAEFLSDIGTFQIGRAPLNYGLGIVWNSGDDLWARYMSTGDMVRLVAKFGSFSFSPAYVVYSTGNTVGGVTNYGSGTPSYGAGIGSGSLTDYSLLLKYENPEDDFEVGVNFIRRIGEAGQDSYNGPPPATTASGTPTVTGPPPAITPVGISYNTWDLYGKKKVGKLTLTGEAPIVSGSIGASTYNTFALAGEANWKFSETWDADLRLGHAPGQPSSSTASTGDYKAFYFHPNYHLGLVMFNYQFANFFGPNTANNPATTANTLRSPYDNPITNANYLNFGGTFHADKWNFHSFWTFARANETAHNGDYFWNTWQRRFVKANADQDANLGWEMDYGTTFQWDEVFQLSGDVGWWFPGQYYQFSNDPAGAVNQTNAAFVIVGRVGINF